MRKFLKLIFSLVLVLGLAFSLVACGNNSDNGGEGQGGSGQSGSGQSGSGQSGEGQGGSGQSGQGGSGQSGQGGSGQNDDGLKVDVKASEAGLTNMLGSGKLYVTTFGQADRAYLKEIVDEAIDGSSVTYTYNDQLQASDVEEGSLVIAVVGYTSKGIAAEITQTGEVARAKAFAEKEGINLVIVQLSGKTRRGDSSDPIIAAATAGSKLTLIFDNGDKSAKATGADFDGKYSTVWCKDKKLFAFSDEWEMNEYFKVILGL